VLLPETPVDEGQQILTRLQRSLSVGLFMHEDKTVFVTFSAGVKVTGGVQIKLPAIKTLAAWAGFHAVTAARGLLTVYKAVNDDFRSPHGADYTPGNAPEAPDWDGGKDECGGGLHFSPSPIHALQFHAEAKRFVECRVAVKDCRKPKAGDDYPQKIKARRCKCIREVDIDGKPVKKGG